MSNNINEINSTINDKLEYLDDTKSLIKEALITKGQEVTTLDTFRNYVTKINDITTCVIDNTEYNECVSIAEEIIGISSTYEMLEYANITFDTQYIVNNNTKLELTLMITDNPTINLNESILSSATRLYNIESAYTDANADSKKWSYYYNNQLISNLEGSYVTELFTFNKKQVLSINKGGVAVDNINYYDLASPTISASTSLHFSCSGLKTKIKFYELKIYENNILIHDYVPVQHKTNLKFGAYDLKSNIFCETE